MQIKTERIGPVLAVEIQSQRLDAGIAATFKDRMAEFIKRGHHAIVVDLSSVNFIDSSGLGALVTCLKLLGRRDNFILCGTSPTVMTVFTLTRMDRVFRFAANRQEGIAALSPKDPGTAPGSVQSSNDTTRGRSSDLRR